MSYSSENRYSKHLYLELEVPNETSQQVNLLLTINFNEDWEELFQGLHVKFGLKGGELKLDLKNCQSRYRDRRGRRISEEVTVEIVDQRGGEHGGSISVQELPRFSANYSVKKTSGESYKFQRIFDLITTKGSEEQPVWVFETTAGESILKGMLEGLKIATLRVTQIPYQVVTTFEVTKHDLYLTGARGLWFPDNIGRNRWAVLERAIATHILEHRVKPYISRVELHYPESGLSDIPPRTWQPPSPDQSPPPSEVQHLISRVVEAESTNFAELAKLANLNPRRDFAGANLRGVDLSRMNLSSPNPMITVLGIMLGLVVGSLTQNFLLGFLQTIAFNFSVAYAYRADFSKVNLSYANLSNTQLSVIDLNSANLEHTNLSGANLNFANLKNANLQSANLSNTNLMKAGVKNAVFGNNSGLSRGIRLDLKRRGAIFTDEDVDGRFVPIRTRLQ